MISYIKGSLIEVDSGYVIVECAGIGYQIYVTEFQANMLPSTGSEVTLFTYMQVKDDGITLYGFADQDSKNVFRLLIGVSGVGPKGALSILSCLIPDDLRIAISTQDSKAISQAQGIGVKTAQRIIIDLKDKLKLEDVSTIKDTLTSAGMDLSTRESKQIASETIEALAALGYSTGEVAPIVRQLDADTYTDVESCLRAALKQL